MATRSHTDTAHRRKTGNQTSETSEGENVAGRGKRLSHSLRNQMTTRNQDIIYSYREWTNQLAEKRDSEKNEVFFAKTIILLNT